MPRPIIAKSVFHPAKTPLRADLLEWMSRRLSVGDLPDFRRFGVKRLPDFSTRTRARQMPKRFDPTTYNPASNPSLPRTNSVIRFGIVFVLVGFVLMAAALWLPRPFRLSAPEIAYGPDHVTVSSAASNTTNDRIAALIRVRIFSALRPSKVNPQVFQEMDRRDVSVTVGPNSTEKVAVIFPLKAGTFPNHAELEVLSRR